MIRLLASLPPPVGAVVIIILVLGLDAMVQLFI